MTAEGHAHPPDHLFTWVDIDDHFRSLAARGAWPSWLHEVSAYWDSVEFTVTPAISHSEVWDWLRNVLGPLSVDPDHSLVLLEPAEPSRSLPVVILPATEDLPCVRRRPEWTESLVTRLLGDPLPPPEAECFPNGVTVGAFHSFKGGVGRTLHSVALARLVAAEYNRRVLLVDADMEAPGISWMMHAQGARADFSFGDLLALLHGSADGSHREVVRIARSYLLNQEMDRVFVLPVQRDPQLFGPPRIEPRNLLAPGRPPYYLTETLAELAHELGAATVLIDLRAGMSEISAPVLLDPRVKRVFVTTVSDQSVRGTVHVLNELARRAPSVRDTDPLPAALITYFDEQDHAGLAASTAEQLGEAISAFTRPQTDETSRRLVSDPLHSPFRPSLLALPAAWSEVLAVLGSSDIAAVLRPLANELAPSSENPMPPVSEDEAERIARDRERLASFAADLRFAESGAGEGAFLRTDSLTALARAHRTDLPVEIVVGAKGAGKTFTYLTMCRRADWKKFVEDLDVPGAESEAPIVPVLSSQHLGEEARTRVEEIRRQAVNRLQGDVSPADLGEFLRDELQSDHPDSYWRRIWLTCFARAAGIFSSPDTVEKDLIALVERKGRAVFVLDGLEDIFQSFHHDARQQQALRVLLTTCPDWLRTLRGRPLGLVVFIRRDLVHRAIHQNVAQFLSKYRNYALQWDPTEALRLVAWTTHHAGALRLPEGIDVHAMSEMDLSAHLLKLWGEQLGTPRSKEARSKEWFLAALSDYNNQIQARDIVWFLAEAAKLATSDTDRWTDRLLPPSAMRRALPSCSAAKIEEIEQEVPALKSIFAQLRSLDRESRKMPFDPERLGLSREDTELLTDNGVIAAVKGEYWMPEIYRQALDFTTGRRPPVLSIRKELRRRAAEL